MKIINDTSVLTQSGYKKVQELTLNDKLIYNNNEVGDIESIKSEFYNGSIYEIKKRISFTNDTFSLLPENRLLVLDSVNNTSKNKQLFDDYIYTTKKPENIFVDGYKKYDMIVNSTPNYVNNNTFNIDEEDARLIGIILADGHIRHRNNSISKRCSIALGESKQSTNTFVKKYLNDRNIRYGISNKNNCDVIRFTCTNIHWLNREYFYDNNKQKIIHNEFKNLSKQLLIQLLRGLIECDGCVRHKKDHGVDTTRFNSSSIKLIYDFMYICRKFNVIIGGGVSREKGSIRYIYEQEVFHNYDNYAITIPIQFKELSKHFNYSNKTINKIKKFFNIHNNKSLERISNVECITNKDTKHIVYDIQVKNKNYIHTFNGIIS